MDLAGVDWLGGRRAVGRAEGQRVDLGAAEAESRDDVEAEPAATWLPCPGPAELTDQLTRYL